jgi:hypothetical protein
VAFRDSQRLEPEVVPKLLANPIKEMGRSPSNADDWYNQLYKSMMIPTIELHPRRDISLRYFYGYSYVYEDTVHFDSTQTHHSSPLERERLQLASL